MSRRNLITLCCLLGVLSSTASAQIFQRRSQSYMPSNYPMEGMIVQPAALQPCPCPCPPGPGNCDDICLAPPKITHHPEQCPPTFKCEPIHIPLVPVLPTDCVNIPFYGKPTSFTHKVTVAMVEEECREVIRFKTIKIDLICCSIDVCVPCEKCWEKSKKCKEKLRETKLEALCRQNGTIDVYALDVPGMPQRFVWAHKLSATDWATKFPGVTAPVYP